MTRNAIGKERTDRVTRGRATGKASDDGIYLTDRPESFSKTIASRLHLYTPGLKAGWADARAEFRMTDDGEEVLLINHLEVMRGFERPYMRQLAKVASCRGGRVLNVGYGLGHIDSDIEGERANVNMGEHFIIELNKEVCAKALAWRESQPHKDAIIIRQGDWKDILDEFKQQGLTFQGVAYDAFPLEAKELHRDFLPFLVRLIELRVVQEHSGVITFYMDSTDGFGSRFTHLLKSLGIGRAEIERVAVELPPGGTQYWTRPFFLTPILSAIAYR